MLDLQRPFTLATRINGRKADLLIDTGSYENILTSAAVTRLSLHTLHLLDDTEVLNGYALKGVGGRRHFDRVNVAAFDAPGVHQTGVTFAALWSGYAPWEVDGVLGMSLLTDYDLDLAPGAKQVALYEPGSACGGNFARVALVQRPRGYSPMVMVVADGRRLMALLDTGAERSILFAPAGSRARASLSVAHAYGVGPAPVGAQAMHVADFRIGAIALQDMDVTAIDQARPGEADMLLGMDFFRRVHVMLSASTGTAWLQYPLVPAG